MAGPEEPGPEPAALKSTGSMQDNPSPSRANPVTDGTGVPGSSPPARPSPPIAASTSRRRLPPYGWVRLSPTSRPIVGACKGQPQLPRAESELDPNVGNPWYPRTEQQSVGREDGRDHPPRAHRPQPTTPVLARCWIAVINGDRVEVPCPRTQVGSW